MSNELKQIANYRLDKRWIKKATSINKRRNLLNKKRFNNKREINIINTRWKIENKGNDNEIQCWT